MSSLASLASACCELTPRWAPLSGLSVRDRSAPCTTWAERIERTCGHSLPTGALPDVAGRVFLCAIFVTAVSLAGYLAYSVATQLVALHAERIVQHL